MKLPALELFSLVGGTALSLRFGHRSSIDIDLFSNVKFSQPEIIFALEKEFGFRFIYKQQHTQFGIFCFIGNVKVISFIILIKLFLMLNLKMEFGFIVKSI